MRRLRPRTAGILCACLVLLGAGVFAGARWTQGWKGSVTLLANWSGEERDQFEENVIDPFERKYRIDVVYQGSSALSQVLAADMVAGNPPDVAVLPGPGELLAYALDGRLQPLDGLFDAGHYDRIWAPEVAVPGREGRSTYWLPVKTGLKSMVWYSGERPTVESAADPERWCLGMESGATSGWPGTDWVEDILLQQAGPQIYEKWANGGLEWTHPAVRKAWTTWGELVGAGRDHAVRALTTGYGEDCAGRSLEHQGSFRAGHWRAAGGDYVHSSEILSDTGPDAGAWEVSGDLAILLNPTEEARQLIRHLAGTGAALPDHSANESAAPDSAQDATQKEIGDILRGRQRETRCWDASDTMPRAMRDAFHQAVLRFLVEPASLEARLKELQKLSVEQSLPVCSRD
ncbi:extracellular solute-binding protein [Streptomyces amakusaensis]|uniref:ABC transporter substrate-binding protein n=1 Tax=Streptomyces amakusaensis TaxID=67271 RepID=A0ABW0AJH3_9ACTN